MTGARGAGDSWAVGGDTAAGSVGIGWRPEIAGLLADLPGLRFTEVIAESLPRRGRARRGAVVTPPPMLDALISRGVSVVPHGVKLSLGGAEPVNPERVAHLADCAQLLGAPMVSEHIAFVRAGGIEAGHLLPVPRSREALDAIVDNVRRTQAELPVPLALEPIAALFDWPDSELSEVDFLTALLDRTGALLLLDVANVYANARNRGEDPAELLDRLPADRIGYLHVAGGAEHDGLYHDTHTDPTPPQVLELVTQVCRRHRPLAVMLERDGHYPAAGQLRAELDAIATAADLPPITGGSASAPVPAAAG